LATWVEFSYTGTPLKVPFFIKWILGLRKQRMLYGPMRVGARIPGVEGGTLGTDQVPTNEAIERFHRAMKRLKTQVPTTPNAIFGSLTREEWVALHLRHAEGHLGFLIPE
jgi:hypothetical protein